MRVSWIPAFAGMTGLVVGFLRVGWGMVWAVDSRVRGNDGSGGVGVTGMVGLCGPSTSWRVNTTSALGRLEAVLTRHFAQDERRGRRIGGSWG